MNTPSTSDDHLINPRMFDLVRGRGRLNLGGLAKSAFVPGGGGGGDPGMGGGGGDPSMGGGGGGAPPMDPSMMGGDPSMGGGAPPPPPPAGGGGGGGDSGALMAKMDQLITMMQGGAGGAQSGANAAGQLKPKIDVNVEIMQIKHMLAKVIDAMGIPVQAQEMVATPEKLTQMAQQQQTGGQQDASMGGGGQGGAPGGIGPVPPMPDMSAGPGAMPKGGLDRHSNGRSYAHAGLDDVMNKAAAIARWRRGRRKGAA